MAENSNLAEFYSRFGGQPSISSGTAEYFASSVSETRNLIALLNVDQDTYWTRYLSTVCLRSLDPFCIVIYYFAFITVELTVCSRSLVSFWLVTYYIIWVRLLGHRVQGSRILSHFVHLYPNQQKESLIYDRRLATSNQQRVYYQIVQCQIWSYHLLYLPWHWYKNIKCIAWNIPKHCFCLREAGKKGRKGRTTKEKELCLKVFLF